MDKYRIKGAFFGEHQKHRSSIYWICRNRRVKTLMALWPKTSAKGDNYLQVSEDKKKAMQPASAPPAPRSPFKPRGNDPQGSLPRNDMDDDIPFAPEFR